MTASKEASGVLREGANDIADMLGHRPASKYVGFALLLAWHYSLWFVPHMFAATELLDQRVTIAWLVNLGATVVFLLLIAFCLGRKRHLSSYRWLYAAAPGLTAAGTLALCLMPQVFAAPEIAYALSFFLGASESAMWILWGERYACVKASYSLRHIGTTFGLTLFVTVGIARILPVYVTTFFTAALPIASGIALVAARRDGARAFPVLLPRSATQGGMKNMVAVSIITFLASIACYFLVAIIPWEALPPKDHSFTLGVLGGAVLMLGLAGISLATKDKANIFKMYPWLIVLIITAFGLFLADRETFFPAFILATGVSSLLEVLLIMYFGILTSKGYVTPAVAFAFSGGFVRAGIAAGNTWAVEYERAPWLAEAITPETCLLLICVLAVLLIPLVRQEFNMIALTAAPPSRAEIDEICAEVSEEFGLSCRESEILVLIARGYTTNNMADKLVISPYTVNTHIRHIYEKMQIHKRSELLSYLNMQRNDF
ncbi:MAG: LuxR C-terminal-related transcriptional regulator [Berryella intestinalis]|uniref:helix-turn-helix transcriptional regulator n=1 Tax=Berryella intestinalis TaxID=1531429 RepID=UPI002A4E9B8C|nr:LuxR C-terminal-related transcriptional regulator [Berryella intestinalis]MDD7368776.1 LuxR C-terminal-related transcriptional regulator [Berryella intestinalis]MDY3129020.1 LuxR C-terminal-related transcriptional regulator [Berryella intestinalis]